MIKFTDPVRIVIHLWIVLSYIDLQGDLLSLSQPFRFDVVMQCVHLAKHYNHSDPLSHFCPVVTIRKFYSEFEKNLCTLT